MGGKELSQNSSLRGRKEQLFRSKVPTENQKGKKKQQNKTLHLVALWYSFRAVWIKRQGDIRAFRERKRNAGK